MIDYQTKCSILADLWMGYREEKEFKEFIEYNDLGLPMAYCLSEGLIDEITEAGQKYIMETFDLLIAALCIDIDKIENGMSLKDLFDISERNK
jgi:hypothetical protein